MGSSPTNIAIIGLGYVGLPLGVEFGKKFNTVGYDVNTQRIQELQNGLDRTLELNSDELSAARNLSFTSDASLLRNCNIYIVTVPTPIDQHHRPNLSPLESASKVIGEVISKGDIVIFESTVYPGCTEEVCIPIIERISKLSFNVDFYAGYSPERINPGDKEHRVNNIVKVTSGSTPAIAERVDELYHQIVSVGTHKASSIRVAEAAKVIENTQRDVNIALINELSLIFGRLGIDTLEVLEAAGSKWNFLPFRPGLVGGHCIGVDPYYLTHKAQEIGYHPEVILSGRRINDGMGEHVADTVLKLMTKKRIHVVDSRILIMGLAFKENCPDVRDTKVMDIISALDSYNTQVDVFDPWVSHSEAKKEYDVNMLEQPPEGAYDAIVLCVRHKEFETLGAAGIRRFGKPEHVLFDVKYLLDKEDVDGRL